MSEELPFSYLADELGQKLKKLGKFGLSVKFIFEGEGVVHCDAASSEMLVTIQDQPADIAISAQTSVWLKLRAKQLSPQKAILT